MFWLLIIYTIFWLEVTEACNKISISSTMDSSQSRQAMTCPTTIREESSTFHILFQYRKLELYFPPVVGQVLTATKRKTLAELNTTNLRSTEITKY